MRNIELRQRDLRRKKGKKHLFIPALIISFIALFFYFFFTDRVLASNALSFILLGNKTDVVYDTFDIYFDPTISENLKNQIVTKLSEVKYEKKERFNTVDDSQKADVTIEYGIGELSIYSDYLLPVGHMYWISDSISHEELIEGSFSILISSSTYSEYENFLKKYYPNLEFDVVDNISEELKEKESTSIGLVKPSELSKELKLLKVGEKYYLDTFDSGLPISLIITSEEENLEFIAKILRKNIKLESNNFNAQSIAKVRMTGVTAIARRLASTIDRTKEYDYPAQRIASFLSDADLTHTSNEVSFVEGCSTYSGMRFCSKPQYIETLLTSGIDLVELTGNHNNDFGSSNNTKTINSYVENGMAYFGGGLDSTDASKPYITEIDGTKIAFLGYNYYDTMLMTGALASSTHAGANSYSSNKVKEDIDNLQDQVDIIIVDFQFQECYSYPDGDVIFPICYKPIANQKETFRQAIDYGADIVIGTQAHQPQTYELYQDGVIFYGLGNLFFDQTPWIGTRQGMILTHYFKEGELIQTRITPTMYDSALQVEIADQDDANLLLELLETARKSL